MMNNDQVVNELKEKKLPTFGTAVERKDRLKKHYGKCGIDGVGINNQVAQQVQQVQKEIQQQQNDSTLKDGTNNQVLGKRSTCLEEIERLKQNREERRKKMNDIRKQKNEREQLNEANGIKVDVDFQVMVENSIKSVPQQMRVRVWVKGVAYSG